MNIKKISQLIDCKPIINSNSEITEFIIDSRQVIFPEKTLFFALKGLRRDGHDFVEQLFEEGVRCFVVEKLPDNKHIATKSNFLVVENSLTALQNLAAAYRQMFSYPITAITGSNGKTIVKEWLFEILSDSKNVLRSPKSYNSQTGVPLSVLMLEKKYDCAIFEAGISKPCEMQHLEHIIKPEIGIFTNIGDAHQENFDTLEQKITEKLTLFRNSKLIIYNADDENIEKQIKKLPDRVKKFGFSLKKKSNLYVKQIVKHKKTSLITAICKNKNIKIEIPFVDNASIKNAVTCLAFLAATNNIRSNYLRRFSTLSQLEMRLEIKHGKNNTILINDTYNSDIGSLKIAIDYIKTISYKKKRTIILSDFDQINASADENIRKIISIINSANIERLIYVGKNLKNHARKINAETIFFDNTEQLIKSINNLNFKDEIILIKGSRRFGLENVAAKLQQKTHRTILEINIQAILHNLNYYKSLIKPETKLMVMVKAFSYGSGSYEIADLLQNHGVDYLGVAYTDEGCELRNAGIKIPVMVMNPDIDTIDIMLKNNLEPEIYNFDILKEIGKYAKKHNIKNLGIHIKLDTGMHRSGFLHNQITDLIHTLKHFNNLKVLSIFSHLAGSEDKSLDYFTHQQANIFIENSRLISNAIGYKPLLHLLNSSGIERFPQYNFDMVRLGIGLYGISPNNQDKLMNISTLKTYISQIKHLKDGDTVGYGRKGKITRPTVMAVVPIGYADGLNRLLSNGTGKMIVNGKFAPIIGSICMDMTMLDVTGISCKTGDEVIVFGDKYTVSHIARQIGTIPYEVLTGISSRVKRVYFDR